VKKISGIRYGDIKVGNQLIYIRLTTVCQPKLPEKLICETESKLVFAFKVIRALKEMKTIKNRPCYARPNNADIEGKNASCIEKLSFEKKLSSYKCKTNFKIAFFWFNDMLFMLCPKL